MDGADRAARGADDRRRLGRVPLRVVLVVVALAYLAVRLRAVLAVHEVWGAMPDSAGYRAPDGSSSWNLVSLTGHAVRPWTVPAVYAALPSDGVRAGAQVVVSIIAWLALAGVVARQVVRPVVAAAGFVAVLVVSCSWAVITWDLAILSESLALSLGVGLVAAWIWHLRSSTWITAATVVLLSALWVFTRLQHVPIVVGTTMLAAVLVVGPAARRARSARTIRAGALAGLVVVSLWGAATVGPQDRAYAARDGYGVSLFGETFALNLRFVILTDPSATQWFRDHGMPEPAGLTGYPREGSIHQDAWETWPDFFARYRADTELRAWVEGEGRRAFSTYTLTNGDLLARRFAGDLGELLVPPASSLGYAFPEPILPGPVAAVVAPEAGPGRLSPVPVLLVAIGATVAARRRWPPNGVLAAVGAVTAVAAVPGLFLAWLGSPVEYARHAVPFTALLPLGLLLVLMAAWDVDATAPSSPSSSPSSGPPSGPPSDAARAGQDGVSGTGTSIGAATARQ